MSRNIRVHIFVSGRVQGVLFRDSARRKAKKIGICGWIKNLPDARVELVAEGEDDKIEEMMKWLKRGPLLAKVDKIEAKQEDYTGEFSNFDIIYI